MDREIPSATEGAILVGSPAPTRLAPVFGADRAGALCPGSGVRLIMADEDPTTESTEPAKTANDLALERLSARLDALESENRELREANKGLWASLHPAAEPVPTSAATSEPQSDAAFDSFQRIIGMKTE